MKEKEKCFVIMPISDQGDYPEEHFTKVYEQIFKPAIENAGYESYRVDENNISDSIIVKIFEAIQDCPMALCDLSNRNPNVLYELGLRQAYDKPVVLVQDDKTERIFDVSGINTISYKSDRLYENVLEAREKITRAIRETQEGKRNSIVKIIKAKTAIVSSEEISKEDQVEILLSSLSEDIKQIKSEVIKKDHLFSNVAYHVSNIEPPNNKIWISLKPGFTKQQIDDLQTLLLSKFNHSFEVQRRGNKLLIIFNEDLPLDTRKKIEDMLRNTIGN